MVSEVVALTLVAAALNRRKQRGRSGRKVAALAGRGTAACRHQVSSLFAKESLDQARKAIPRLENDGVRKRIDQAAGTHLVPGKVAAPSDDTSVVRQAEP